MKMPMTGNVQGFNPCFNGSMYKNEDKIGYKNRAYVGFNPCFNGSMYKNILDLISA